MHTAHLRKVSGSLMRAVPPALLDVVPLTAAARVALAEGKGRLVIARGRKRESAPAAVWMTCWGALPRASSEPGGEHERASLIVTENRLARATARG